MTVVAPAFSLMEEELSASETVGVSSSSAMVRVWSEGAATPLPPAAVAETVTCLSGASTSLSTAVMVTVPVLVVAPAAMVSVVPACVKSPETAGDTGAEETVRVTAWLDTAPRVAVTVVVPAFSLMEEALSPSETIGVSSSSAMVRVWSAGAATPLPPAAVAETVTCLSGASTALSAPVIVTVPVLVVAPAAMVRVLAVLRLKSPETAGETAAAETVRVTSSLDLALSVAVTVVDPPSSEMDEEPNVSDTVGVPSSSVIASVRSDGAATPLPPAAVAETVTSLSGASTSLSTAVIVTVPVLLVAPAAMVRVVPACVKSPETAGDTGAEETVRVTA